MSYFLVLPWCFYLCISIGNFSWCFSSHTNRLLNNSWALNVMQIQKLVPWRIKDKQGRTLGAMSTSKLVFSPAAYLWKNCIGTQCVQLKIYFLSDSVRVITGMCVTVVCACIASRPPPCLMVVSLFDKFTKLSQMDDGAVTEARAYNNPILDAATKTALSVSSLILQMDVLCRTAWHHSDFAENGVSFAGHVCAAVRCHKLVTQIWWCYTYDWRLVAPPPLLLA